jgi:hypothetical protein
VQMPGTVKAPVLSMEAVSPMRARLPDLLGIAWVLVAGVAVLVPALAHGIYLGPADILSRVGLTAQHGSAVHNPTLRDQIAVLIPSAGGPGAASSSLVNLVHDDPLLDRCVLTDARRLPFGRHQAGDRHLNSHAQWDKLIRRCFQAYHYDAGIGIVPMTELASSLVDRG